MMAEALLRDADVRILSRPGLLAYPQHWQWPAITEKFAWTEMARPGAPGAEEGAEGAEYLGLPWATMIDGLRTDAAAVWAILTAIEEIRVSHPRRAGQRRATVAQHIHADRFAAHLEAAGVTDLFWTHATVERQRIGALRIHPFPLYPAQTAHLPPPDDPHRPRRYLANFIGAHNPKVYLTDVRTRIFEEADRADDLLIVRRDAWHFNRTVYDEQLSGLSPDPAQLDLEERRKEEYLAAIRDSTFTLCPTGSGPNSIRIGEALALGSIPIILSRSLWLAGEPALWREVCVIDTDSAEGFRRALLRARTMSPAEIRRRQEALPRLYAAIRPAAWGRLIRDTLAAA